MLPRIFLKQGQDRRLSRGYPWAFSNEVRMDEAAKALAPGQLVTVHRHDSKAYGIGTFNPHALICLRLLDGDVATPIDAEFFASRLARAVALRQRLFPEPFYRLVHGEADGLAGLIIDRYGEVLALQANTAGMDALLPLILEALVKVLAPRTVVLRNDSPMRQAEGLAEEVRIAIGSVEGPVEVREGKMRYFADVVAGQKTGWFFDQRETRGFVAPLAVGAPMLDAYCHTGGFALAAAAAGASSCTGIDSSEPALALAVRAAAANGYADRVMFRRAQVFEELERLGQTNARFRLVTCDPPAFVKSRKDLASGLRAYRKLARLAARLVEPEGFLLLASCSHNVDRAAFAGEVARGIQSGGRSGRILREAGAAADHPQHLHLAENAYLKSLLLQLD